MRRYQAPNLAEQDCGLALKKIVTILATRKAKWNKRKDKGNKYYGKCQTCR